MLKAAIKHSAGEDNVRHRVVPADIFPKWVKKVEALRDEVATILNEEKEEKQVTWVVECHSNRFYSYIILDPTGGNGTQEGTKYDRASR